MTEALKPVNAEMKRIAEVAGKPFRELKCGLGLATGATWLIIAVFFRYSSLAAIVSALFATFFFAAYRPLGVTTVAVAAMSALLIWRHRANIRKLLTGTESRLGAKAKS